jgi:hypothetical protein
VLGIWIQIRRIRMFLGLPNPDPLSQRYRSGSGSLYHRAKIVGKKNLESYSFVIFYDFLSLKTDVNVSSKSNKQKKTTLLVTYSNVRLTGYSLMQIRIFVLVSYLLSRMLVLGFESGSSLSIWNILLKKGNHKLWTV